MESARSKLSGATLFIIIQPHPISEILDGINIKRRLGTVNYLELLFSFKLLLLNVISPLSYKVRYFGIISNKSTSASISVSVSVIRVEVLSQINVFGLKLQAQAKFTVGKSGELCIFFSIF